MGLKWDMGRREPDGAFNPTLRRPRGDFAMSDMAPDLVPVTVLVHKDQVSEVYRLVAGLLAGPPAETAAGKDYVWRPGDEQLAVEVVRAGNDNARAIYR